MNIIEQACSYFHTQKEFAEAIGATEPYLSTSLKKGAIHSKYWRPIQSATSGRITVDQLCASIHQAGPEECRKAADGA